MEKMPKVRKQLVLSAQELEEWVSSYETQGKLPQINIPCVKCNTGVVAGHENLRNKVKKYGNIRNLLTTFVCRDCKTSVPGTIKKINTPKQIKAPKVLEKKTDKKIYDLPKVNLNVVSTRYSLEDLASNASLAKEFTNGVCIRPQLFLNNDRNCDDCILYTNCACNSKTLSKSRRKQLENV